MDMKVFSSKITRTSQEEKNNLYDLLKPIPAVPVTIKNTQKNGCEFRARNDKCYEPKKKSKLKVKTVRDIRNTFEKDVYSYLPSDLEKQQVILLNKIIDGSSKTTGTQKLASTILNCDNPISRSAWQMLMNINPEGNVHPIQYVLWNNKRIRVCGSKGGKNKLISRVDLGKRKEELKRRKSLKRTQKGLLQNSLSVKFKPGPLKLKKYLDDSYQKYHVGNIELVDLPKPGLEIQAIYGCSLDPTITNFLNGLRDIDGNISQKWAEFAVSVLGTIKANNEVQIVKQSNVTFDLCFKYGQSRILMRRDIDGARSLNSDNPAVTERLLAHHETDVIPEVKNIICEMIDCVEISLKQDNMYSGVDDVRDVANDIDLKVPCNNLVKEKPKKKFNELNRLHVTVIRLAENNGNRNAESSACNNSFCALGCVCFSLQCPLNLRRHCGRIDCMFECKCNFSKYKALDIFDSECPDVLPDLYNLDNAANSKLAKEEQKFHQTVIMTGEKSILLKSQRRNWKASRKYFDFYKNMPLRPELKGNRILTIVDRKLNCENIEPWCMVHNLYKCFCKGKFVNKDIAGQKTHDSSINKAVELKEKNIAESDVKPSDVNKTLKYRQTLNKLEELSNNVNVDSDVHSIELKKLLKTDYQSDITPCSRLRKQPERLSCSVLMSKRKSNNFESDSDNNYEHYTNNECARVKPYGGRKFSDGYYNNTNLKIWELEKNDSKLRKRLASFTRNIDVEDKSETATNISTNNYTTINISDEINMNETEVTKSKNIEDEDVSAIQDTRLKTWLENAFKQYKKSCSKGGITALQAPQANKLALYPWDFILSRYRERKNHFLVSTRIPFRMFMAVDIKHSFFQDCINIDNIRFADLYKYPVTVKNLLTNATNLKDSFCILSGLPYCWELKGSVTKVIETNSVISPNNNITEIPETVQSSDFSDRNESISDGNEINAENIPETTIDKNVNNSEISKWFVMTVVNDFVEIQLSNRGFFVTYTNILNALRIARVSGKTARLSGVRNVEKDSCTPFGVYAIPNVNEDCVFIGPYESDEPLGIKTVSVKSLVFKKNRTRGFWITTNKIDNIKVIDNPMSFVPPTRAEKSDLVSLDINSNDLKEKLVVSDKDNTLINDAANIKADLKPKNVKPIKIRKSDNIFKVTAESVVNPITVQRMDLHPESQTISNTNIFSSTLPSAGPSCLVTYVVESKESTDINVVSDSSMSEENVLAIPPTEEAPQIKISSVASIANDDNVFLIPHTEEGSSIKITSVTSIPNEENYFLDPPTEEGPQIKISSVYSEADKTLDEKYKDPKIRGNMFVLKPEEINKRLLNKSGFDSDVLSKVDDNAQIKMNETEIDTDIENFLTKSVISSGIRSEVLIISDDDEEPINERSNIWIECINIDNFGWIPGKRGVDCTLSFKFPGFQYSAFYPEEIAFCKINQVLSRKICIPQNITMEWRTTETMNDLKSTYQLKCDHLSTDLVLTSRGLRHKLDLMNVVVRNIRTYSRTSRKAITNSQSGETSDKVETDEEAG